jgi:hypothetical protein
VGYTIVLYAACDTTALQSGPGCVNAAAAGHHDQDWSNPESRGEQWGLCLLMICADSLDSDLCRLHSIVLWLFEMSLDYCRFWPEPIKVTLIDLWIMAEGTTTLEILSLPILSGMVEAVVDRFLFCKPAT